MANLIIQENGMARTRPAVNGEELTILTPCDCSAVEGVQINGVAFPFYDTLGNVLSSRLFAEGSLIRVMIDATNRRALILNSATRPKQTTITFTAANWIDNENGFFTQTVTVNGGTANSLVALQPTATQIATLQNAGVSALMVDNNGGTFTATAVGAKPTADMTVQATITEVTV